MFRSIQIVTTFVLLAVNAANQRFQVIHSPSNVVWPEQSSIKDLSVSDSWSIVSTVLGLTRTTPSSFSLKTDALNRPAAVFLVEFAATEDGSKVLLEKVKHSYELKSTKSDGSMYDLSNVVESLDEGKGDSMIIEMNGEDVTIIGTGLFPDGVNGDLSNLQRLHEFFSSPSNFKGIRSSPDFFTIRLQTPNSSEIAELLRTVITDVRSFYNDNVAVFALFTSMEEQVHSRQKRAAVNAKTRQAPTEKAAFLMPENSYKFIDHNYPFKFGIVLFVTLFLIIIVLFIAVAMWTMEPGKDTIIYRMTQSKKKDL